MREASPSCETRLVGAAVGLFLASLALSFVLLERPTSGGDELWFATPLVTRPVTSLQLFQFEYAGPLKTLLTWPLFATVGFSIHSLRLFSIATYVAMSAAWCVYLHRTKLPVAAAATLTFLALNPDLQFFSRDDINQPTLHNLVVLLHFLAFVAIAEKGPTVASGSAFLLLSFIDVNAHVRNIWICNALVLAFVVDHAVTHGVSRASAIAAARRGWPILAGWGVGAAAFAHVLIRFDGSPGLEGAKALGSGYTWGMRAREVAEAIPELLSGARVLTAGYEVDLARNVAEGAMMLVLTAAAWVFARPALTGPDRGSRLARLSIVVWLAVIVQYALTKSARWPWHGNTVILFWGIVFGMTVHSLWSARRRELAFVYAFSVATVFIANRTLLERAIAPSVVRKTGFELAVWNPQGLDAVRRHVRAHPASYVFADWAIGRALALELHYLPQAGTTAVLYDSGMADEAVQGVRPDQVVLRAVGAARTVPDMSDARMAGLGMEFKPFVTVNDSVGREAYQLGHIVPRR